MVGLIEIKTILKKNLKIFFSISLNSTEPSFFKFFKLLYFYYKNFSQNFSRTIHYFSIAIHNYLELEELEPSKFYQKFYQKFLLKCATQFLAAFEKKIKQKRALPPTNFLAIPAHVKSNKKGISIVYVPEFFKQFFYFRVIRQIDFYKIYFFLFLFKKTYKKPLKLAPLNYQLYKELLLHNIPKYQILKLMGISESEISRYYQKKVIFSLPVLHVTKKVKQQLIFDFRLRNYGYPHPFSQVSGFQNFLLVGKKIKKTSALLHYYKIFLAQYFNWAITQIKSIPFLIYLVFKQNRWYKRYHQEKQLKQKLKFFLNIVNLYFYRMQDSIKQSIIVTFDQKNSILQIEHALFLQNINQKLLNITINLQYFFHKFAYKMWKKLTKTTCKKLVLLVIYGTKASLKKKLRTKQHLKKLKYFFLTYCHYFSYFKTLYQLQKNATLRVTTPLKAKINWAYPVQIKQNSSFSPNLYQCADAVVAQIVYAVCRAEKLSVTTIHDAVRVPIEKAAKIKFLIHLIQYFLIKYKIFFNMFFAKLSTKLKYKKKKKFTLIKCFFLMELYHIEF